MAAHPRKRKTKFRHIRFKLSVLQYGEMLKLCRAMGLTPNKMFKKALKEFMHRNAHLIPDDPEPVSRNQLKLFDESYKPVQLSILDGLPEESGA
jgi:hypothetical protein